MTENLYKDPELVAIYDLLNAGRADFDFYLSHLPADPLRILDIGCGTGTLALDMARLGHEVVGLDPADQMLHNARHKTGADQVTWRHGTIDMLDDEIGFDAAFMSGHAFQCLLEDHEIAHFFGHIHRVLRQDGVFMFETRNPNLRIWEEWCPARAKPAKTTLDGDQVKVIHHVHKVAQEIVHFEESYIWASGKKTAASQSRLRFADVHHIADLAAKAGLVVMDIFGDWSGKAFADKASREIIFKLQKS